MDIFCRITLKSHFNIKDTVCCYSRNEVIYVIYLACTFRVGWGSDLSGRSRSGSGRHDEIAYLLQWTHRKPLQFKQTLGSTCCCGNYTQNEKDSIWSSEWAECVSVWPVPKGSADMTDRWEDNCWKLGIEWGVGACVSVYMCRENRCSRPPFFSLWPSKMIRPEAQGAPRWYLKWDL